MKIAGWILLVLGVLSLIGCLVGGSNPFGPLFWIGLGIYLIYLANRREKDKKDKEKWSNNG